MKKSELKQLIKEIILEAKPKLKTDEQLKSAILEYKSIQQKIKDLEDKNEAILNQLKQYKSSEKTTLSDIQKYMIRFNKSMIVVDKWVATLESELKYSEPTKGVSYKELYLNLKEKVNGLMKKQEDELYQAQIDAASVMREIKVQIKDLNEANILSKLFNKLKSIYASFISNTSKFELIIKKLPKI